MEDNTQNNFNRMAFLQKVITEFINKPTYASRKTLFDGYLKLIHNSTNARNKEQNQEKIRILEKCFDLFNNPTFFERVKTTKEQYNPQIQALATAITKAVSERILSDRKRQYDMAKLYSEGQINSDSLVFRGVNDGLSKSASDISGTQIQITHTGSLTYATLSVSNESIQKYRIIRQLSESESQEYDVFSYIDLNEFEKNKEYRDAVLNELLSENNIELSNVHGYIGSIVNTSGSNQPLSVGEESKNIYGFYKYQVSPKYALEFDTQDLSAVVDFSRKQGLSSQQKQNKKENKDQDLEK